MRRLYVAYALTLGFTAALPSATAATGDPAAAGSQLTHPVARTTAEPTLKQPLRSVAVARAALSGPAALRTLTHDIDRELGAGYEEIELGVRNIVSGALCEGARTIVTGADRLRESGKRLDRIVTDLGTTIRRDSPGRAGGDADDRDFLWHDFGYRRGLLARAEHDVRQLEETYATLCASVVGPKKVRGTIEEIVAADRTLKLDDGTVVVLADVPLRAHFGEGSDVTVKGLAMKDGSIVATDVDVAVSDAKPSPQLLKCLALRIAPAQSWDAPTPPLPPPNLVLHEPQGYALGGKLWLEAAMRLGVKANNCPKVVHVGSSGPRASMKIELTYKDTVQKKIVTSVIGDDLTGKEAPVRFPATVSSSEDVTIVASYRVATCQLVLKKKWVKFEQKTVKKLKCGPAAVHGTESYTARVRNEADGPYFVLKYDGVEMDGTIVLLDLNENDDSFRAVKLGGLAPSLSELLIGGTSYSLEAKGFLVTANSSSKPNVKTIKVGDSFAAYPAGWSLGDTDPIVGLHTGRVNGTRNGKAYSYTAGQPPVISDVVTFCPGVDSYYRLPWKSNLPHQVTQGNGTSFTHTGAQTYAFDFGLANGETIYAARGGWVTWIEESLTATSDPNKVKDGEQEWAPANALRIEHQDGTASWYFHMQPNGVLPAVNTRVLRGAQVAITGNTGNSTGPHLHYQVQSAPAESTTIQVRFQTGASNCVIPASDTWHVSNNSGIQ